jgi:hypothetical protein
MASFDRALGRAVQEAALAFGSGLAAPRTEGKPMVSLGSVLSFVA